MIHTFRSDIIVKGFNNKLQGGRWVTLKNDNKVYIKDGVVMSGSKDNKSSSVEKVLSEKENEIHSLDYERAVVVYSDGTTEEINGEARQVDVNSLDPKKTKGQIFTHNHPSWKLEPKKRCSPLSSGDMVVALNLGFKEMRAVAKHDGYSMKIGESIEIDFGIGVVSNKKKYNRGEIPLEDMFKIRTLITDILYDHQGKGNNRYNELLDNNIHELEAQRTAQIFHYNEAFKEIHKRIKGIEIKKINR